MQQTILTTTLIILSFSVCALDKAPLDSFPAPGAHQGVAVDAQHAYAINNTSVTKYDRYTGEKVAVWNADKDHPLIHMNAAIVRDGKLYCAHSNHPLLPMRSSLEIFDTETLTHLGQHDFGETDGSLTWIDWHKDSWWACFAHYSKRGGDPEKGHEKTRFVQYDTDWNEIKSWTFPAKVLEKFAPYSCSGGAWISEDILLVTGHDLPEAYALRLPESGNILTYTETLKVPFYGQGIDYNPQAGSAIYGILRKTETIVTVDAEKLLQQ